jgi:hypothetical protein
VTIRRLLVPRAEDGDAADGRYNRSRPNAATTDLRVRKLEADCHFALRRVACRR